MELASGERVEGLGREAEQGRDIGRLGKFAECSFQIIGVVRICSVHGQLHTEFDAPLTVIGFAGWRVMLAPQAAA